MGGGLAGLSAAVLLGHWGVPCVVLEKHAGTAPYPRSRNTSPRSMEIYRQAGVEDDIRAAVEDHARTGGMGDAQTLADEELRLMVFRGDPSVLDGTSPVEGAMIDQDRLEPILLRHAERLGARIRHGAEVVGLEQDEHGVRALVRDRATGAMEAVEGAYLVGADGANSRVRELIGATLEGPGEFGRQVSIVFRADLTPALRGRDVAAVFTRAVGGHITRRDAGRWQLNVPCDEESVRWPQTFTEEACRDFVRRATGLSDLEVELVTVAPWNNTALVATPYRSGRVFLAGDAAHVMGPWSGSGGNTGIQDVHNLAWKLAGVLAGWADPALLDSYERERRPVAERTVTTSVGRMHAFFDGRHDAELERDTWALFGGYYQYGGDALEPPSGEPGTRVPNVVIEGVPLLDLVGRGFTLLTATDGWEGTESVPLTVLRIPAKHWADRFGVTDGAVLIRPDGFVAARWREAPQRPREALRLALTS